MTAMRSRPAILTAALLLIACGAAHCGPSPAQQAAAEFRAAVTAPIEDEAVFNRGFLSRLEGQQNGDPPGPYRAFLESKAAPYYDALAKKFESVPATGPHLEKARAAMLAYAKARREFVAFELRRVELMAKAPDLVSVRDAMEEADASRADYLKLVGDGAPDGRYSQVSALYVEFPDGPYKKAIEGSADVEDVVRELRSVLLPRVEALRNDRFGSTPEDRAFRRLVVAVHDLLTVAAQHLPSLVEVVRTAKMSERADKDAATQQQLWVQAIRDAEK